MLILILIGLFSFFVEIVKNIIYSSDKYKISKLSPKSCVHKALSLKENLLSLSLLLVILDTFLSTQLGYFSNKFIDELVISVTFKNLFKILTVFFILIVNLFLKVIAVKYSEILLVFFSYPISFMYTICYPIVLLLDFISFLIKKVFSIKDNILSPDELRKQIAYSINSDFLKKDDRFNFFKNILNFFELTIREIMIHKDKIPVVLLTNPNLANIPDGYFFLVDEYNKVLEVGINKKNLELKDKILSHVLIPAKTFVVNILDIFLNYEIGLVIDNNGEVLGIIDRKLIYSLLISKNNKLKFKKEKNSFVFLVDTDIKLINQQLNWDLPENFKSLSGLLNYYNSKNLQSFIINQYEIKILQKKNRKPLKVAIRQIQ